MTPDSKPIPQAGTQTPETDAKAMHAVANWHGKGDFGKLAVPAEDYRRLETERNELRQQLAELSNTFDLRYAADMRAIKRWQEAHPDKPLTWPDHADLCIWLAEQLAASKEDAKRMDEIRIHNSTVTDDALAQLSLAQAREKKLLQDVARLDWLLTSDGQQWHYYHNLEHVARADRAAIDAAIANATPAI